MKRKTVGSRGRSLFSKPGNSLRGLAAKAPGGRRLRFEQCERRTLLAGQGLASISGTKFEDLTADGFSMDDVPLGGVAIELFRDDGDGVFDDALDALVDTDITDAVTGEYTFNNVTPGVYFIREVTPAGMTQTAGPDFYSVLVSGGCVFSLDGTTIDDFEAPVPVDAFFISALDPDPTLFKHSAADGIIGGERDALIDVLGAANPLSASIVVGFDGTLGAFSFASAAPGTTATLQYDGADADDPGPPAALINAFGLADDLTSGGASTGFLLEFLGVDPGQGAVLGLDIRATSPGGGTATFTGVVPASLTPFVHFVPFASFATAGGFSFAGVDSLEVQFNAIGNADVDFEVDSITTSDMRSDGYDFGNFIDASIHGMKFLDRDGDGVKDAGEPGLENWEIELRDAAGNLIDQMTTDTDGNYWFMGLAPGTYTVNEVLQAGWMQTAGIGGYTIVVGQGVPSGGQSLDNDFGNRPLPSSLSGFVYNDKDNDGVFDATESGIPGAVVTLMGVDFTGAMVTEFSTTDSAGHYEFTDLLPGTYEIKEIQPAGFLDGKDTIGTPGGDTANDRFFNIMLPLDFDGMNNNFGEVQPASLSGFVYVDVNDNGIKDPPELGIGGVKVTLTGIDDLGGVVNMSVFTGTAGSYFFGNLRPGTYELSEMQPNGFIDGKDTIGTQGGMTADDLFFAIVLGPCVDGVHNNFGERGLDPSVVSKDLLLSSTPNPPNIGGTGHTVGGGTGVTVTSLPVDPAVENWVQRLYQDVLGRTGSNDEVHYWLQQVASGTSYTTITDVFVNGVERRTGVIDQLYHDYLGRGVDPVGLNGWLNVWQQTGGPEAIQAGIIGSPEYYQFAGGTDSLWVDALYNNILGRGAAQHEIDYWVDRLSEVTTGDVVLGFVLSHEYRKDMIRDWYLDYLNRQAEEAGVDFWVSILEQQGQSQGDIQAGLLASAEYRARP